VIASLIGVNNALTALDFSFNDLKDEGVSAVCEAIKRNKETKLASLNVKENGIGPMGANAVAAMVAVTGALTSINLSNNHLTNFGGDMTGIKELAAALGVNGALTVTNLLGNQLDAESAKMLAEVAKQKGISLCGIQRDQTTADFRGKGLKPPDAILLGSDLSQAVVTGALTHLSLVGNEKLGDEGVEALSVAIEQSKSLKTLDLSSDSECQPSSKRVSTMFGPKGATALAKALAINSSLTQIEYAGSMQLFRHLLITCAFWFLCLQVAGQLPWSQGCHGVRGRLARQQLSQEGMFPYQPTPA